MDKLFIWIFIFQNVGLSQNVTNLLKLIQRALALEQGFECIKLSHYGADGKYVDRVVIKALVDYLFGASIPSGACVLCEGRHAVQGLDTAKVTDPDGFFGDQDVFRLEVPVEVPNVVHELYSFK